MHKHFFVLLALLVLPALGMQEDSNPGSGLSPEEMALIFARAAAQSDAPVHVVRPSVREDVKVSESCEDGAQTLQFSISRRYLTATETHTVSFTRNRKRKVVVQFNTDNGSSISKSVEWGTANCARGPITRILQNRLHGMKSLPSCWCCPVNIQAQDVGYLIDRILKYKHPILASKKG